MSKQTLLTVPWLAFMMQNQLSQPVRNRLNFLSAINFRFQIKNGTKFELKSESRYDCFRPRADPGMRLFIIRFI